MYISAASYGFTDREICLWEYPGVHPFVRSQQRIQRCHSSINDSCWRNSSHVELVLHCIDNCEAEAIKNLGTDKLQKPNITSAESHAVRDLYKNKELIILSANVSNSTVIMDPEEYFRKMNNDLDDSAYKPTERNPITYLQKITRAKILMVNLSQETKQRLISKEKSSRCPKPDGLPKMHKQNAEANSQYFQPAHTEIGKISFQ